MAKISARDVVDAVKEFGGTAVTEGQVIVWGKRRSIDLRRPSSLPPPANLSLPCFVYGVFKPEELAFYQLEGFLGEPPRQAEVSGRLYLRDGIPLLELGDGGKIKGYLLRFRVAQNEQAYTAICESEPPKHYEWRQVQIDGAPANILVGIAPQAGGAVEAVGNSWKSEDDPVFVFGMSTVEEVAKNDATTAFVFGPDAGEFDWPKFFRLQMAYLMLWSVIERYTALRFGPNRDPMDRVKRLDQDPLFTRAFGETDSRPDAVVFDSRDPETKLKLARKPAQYYYQVRSNLSHRGKSAWNDGETVRRSLDELLGIFKTVLATSRV